MFDSAAGQPADDRDLVARFGCVRVHERPAARPTGWPPPRAARASTRRRTAARTRRAARPLRGAVPPLARCATLSSIDASRRLLQPRRARRASAVHHALADRRAGCPLSRRRFEHHVGVVHGLHRQHRGGAAAQQLGRSPAARRRAASPACAPLPSATRASRSQSISGEVVGVAAEQRLAEVDVRLDEAGSTQPPRASTTRSWRRGDGSAPIAAMRPSRIETSPCDDVEARRSS